MQNSIKKGFSFGITSGIITTLGLMVGMFSSTNSQAIVIGSIITIAIADSLSDGLGMHLSEESQKNTTSKNIWQATFSTVITKFIVALTFIIPVLIFSLPTAIIISIFWGLILLIIFSYYIAKNKNDRPVNVICEHIFIAVLVITVTYFIGIWISSFYK